MMLFFRHIASLALAAALTLHGAEAASDTQPPQVEPPMRVLLVHSEEPGCQPDCAAWISAEGAITAQTPELFRQALWSIGKNKVPIVIMSPGGDVGASYTIGRMIRAAGLDVVVGRTSVRPCPVVEVLCTGRLVTGTPTSHLSYCASACAFVLAAGVHRYVAADAVVGVHQLTSMVTYVQRERLFSVQRRLVRGVPVEVGRKVVSEFEISRITKPTNSGPKAYDAVDKYFAQMGIGAVINGLVQATPRTSIHWMTRGELAETGLATNDLGADQLVHRINLAGATLLQRAALARLQQPRLLLPGLPIIPPAGPLSLTPIPADVPVPAVANRIRASGGIQVGHYGDARISFALDLYWQNDFPYIALVATSTMAGLSDLDHALTFDVFSADGQVHRFVPVGPNNPGMLKGALTAEQICGLRRDPTLKIRIEPRPGSGVSGDTLTLSLLGFRGLAPLVEAACRART